LPSADPLFAYYVFFLLFAIIFFRFGFLCRILATLVHSFLCKEWQM
jgi:hypothetical protein